MIFRLKDGAEQWDVLNRIREVGIDIGTYGCFEPSLNDIFVACVGDENHTDEEGGRVR